MFYRYSLININIHIWILFPCKQLNHYTVNIAIILITELIAVNLAESWIIKFNSALSMGFIYPSNPISIRMGSERTLNR
jgi:hypothetical protein